MKVWTVFEDDWDAGQTLAIGMTVEAAYRGLIQHWKNSEDWFSAGEPALLSAPQEDDRGWFSLLPETERSIGKRFGYEEFEVVE